MEATPFMGKILSFMVPWLQFLEAVLFFGGALLTFKGALQLKVGAGGALQRTKSGRMMPVCAYA